MSERVGIAETYSNTLYLGHTVTRWWAHERILVGGSLLSVEDWAHLQTAYGCTHIVNVETEHSDEGKGTPLVEARVPDDGSPIPVEKFLAVYRFAQGRRPGDVFYVHCQQGGSRSPAFAYFLMRALFGLSSSDALARIRVGKEGYGDHVYHRTYMASADAALASL